MQTLSEDDVNLRELSDDELDRAWDLWFDLAQATNEWDPPYSHGVFVNLPSEAQLDYNRHANAVPHVSRFT